MSCDMILMEEEMATFWQIMQLKAAGKQTGIWTVNKESGMKHFLNSGADFIITDEIPMGVEMQDKLKERTDTELMEDRMSLCSLRADNNCFSHEA